MKRFLQFSPFPILLILLSAVGGCNWQAAREAQRQAAIAEKEALMSANQMKQLMIAIINYESVHDKWPAELADVRPFVEMDNLDELLVNPVTNDNPGYEYVAPQEGDDVDSSVLSTSFEMASATRACRLPMGISRSKKSVNKSEVHPSSQTIEAQDPAEPLLRCQVA